VLSFFSMQHLSARGVSASAALAVFGAIHCGGATTGVAGGDAAAGHPTPNGSCAPASEATNRRPQAVACVSTPGASVDGGSLDQCLVDSECADGGVCSCQGNSFGYAHESIGNSCVAANCREDSDCGPGGACSPTVDQGCGPFYGVVGYFCHTCADQCENDSDCESDGGPAGYCAYEPTVGYWACGYGFCAG
jgi:hypothetical protein